jgi:hypothetical protein
MDDVSGRTAQVWVKGDSGPQHIVMQVYDKLFLDVTDEVDVRTRHDVIQVADRYGVPLDAVEFLGESARIIDENSEAV